MEGISGFLLTYSQEKILLDQKAMHAIGPFGEKFTIKMVKIFCQICLKYFLFAEMSKEDFHTSCFKSFSMLWFPIIFMGEAYEDITITTLAKITGAMTICFGYEIAYVY